MTELQLRFGAPVMRGDERLGRLAGVILDGARRRCEAIIVERGLLRRSHWIVPRSAVSDATDERIVLDAPPTALANEPTSRRVDAGTIVRAEDGRALGRLVLLLVQEDGRLLELVVQRRAFGPRRTVPAETLTAAGAPSAAEWPRRPLAAYGRRRTERSTTPAWRTAGNGLDGTE